MRADAKRKPAIHLRRRDQESAVLVGAGVHSLVKGLELGTITQSSRVNAEAKDPELRRLEGLVDAWTAKTLETLRTVSPSALCWTLEALRRGADLTLPQCQAAELALTRTTMPHPDFAEGVRAMVVDKDRNPRWQPARIEDVDPAAIAALFG